MASSREKRKSVKCNTRRERKGVFLRGRNARNDNKIKIITIVLTSVKYSQMVKNIIIIK